MATDARTLIQGDVTALLVAAAHVNGVTAGTSFSTTVVSAAFDAGTGLTTLVLADDELGVGTDIDSLLGGGIDPVTLQPLGLTVYDRPVGGLEDARLYYVVKVDDTTVRLVVSAAAAEDGRTARPHQGRRYR